MTKWESVRNASIYIFIIMGILSLMSTDPITVFLGTYAILMLLLLSFCIVLDILEVKWGGEE